MSKYDDETYAQIAKQKWEDLGQIELDDSPAVSAGDSGAFVQAWVFVGDDDVIDEEVIDYE